MTAAIQQGRGRQQGEAYVITESLDTRCTFRDDTHGIFQRSKDNLKRLGTLAVQIDSMKRKHVEACASIMGRLELFKKYKYTSAAARTMLECALKDRHSKLVIATHHRTVVGFAWFVPRGAFDRSGYLRLLAVDAPFHGQGIGRRLMNFLEKRHLHSGGIVLLASSFNDDAQGFYERLGYRPVGELPNYVHKGFSERIYFKPPPG